MKQEKTIDKAADGVNFGCCAVFIDGIDAGSVAVDKSVSVTVDNSMHVFNMEFGILKQKFDGLKIPAGSDNYIINIVAVDNKFEAQLAFDNSFSAKKPEPATVNPDPVPVTPEPAIITPEPEAEPETIKQEEKRPEQPEHPDMYNSLTSRGVWSALYHTFGEGSFVNVVKNIPVTCLVTAEREAVRVVMMMEDEEQIKELGGMEIPSFEYNYAKCTQQQFQESLEMGETITPEKMQNDFTVLEHEEDRAELIDYLMMFIEAIPHVIVEGNTFRSRRPGEEILEIDQTLTAKVMSHKMMQLFEPDGEIMDILRRKNIEYCLIGSYNEYLKIIFVDTDDETIHTIRYDFSDLVDADFLEGEGCFSRLTCAYERDALDEYLGRAVCDMPYFNPGISSSGDVLFWQIYLNKDVISEKDELYVPYAEEETESASDADNVEIPAEPEIPEVQEIPEAQDVSAEPYIIDDSDFEDDVIPAVSYESKESEEPAVMEELLQDVEHSSTTQALRAMLQNLFAPGGAFTARLVSGEALSCTLQAMKDCLSVTVNKADGSAETMPINYLFAISAPEKNKFTVLQNDKECRMLEAVLLQDFEQMEELETEGCEIRLKKEDPLAALRNSPTTQELLKQLKAYFAPGGAFRILMETSPVVSATLNTGDKEVLIAFRNKNDEVYVSVKMEYYYFGKGQADSYAMLEEMDDQDNLEEIIWEELPYLRN